MNRLLSVLFDLRFGERRMALMMTAYHFLLLVTLYLLKPVRDSLFLTEVGALELPFVFMVTTVAVIPVAALHVRAGRRMQLSRLVNGVAVILIFNLLGLRWLVQIGGAWVYYLLYAWVSIYAVLVTSQFWLLANAVFTGARAKRVFPLLSAGAIIGSVVGGEVTGLLVDRWGMNTENLLLVAAGLLAASSLIVTWVRVKSESTEGAPVHEADEGPPANLFGTLKTLQTSSHLQLIVGVIALAVIATTIIDYQFKTVAAEAFTTEGALTTFMGRFYGRVSLVAFLLQVFLAPRLIRLVGVGGALSFLPLTLALGSVGMLVVPGLIAGTAVRGIDQSLRHSIDKTGRELLFVPIGMETKKRVKVFIDLFFDQGMQGVGGALLLLLTLGLGLSVGQLSVVVLSLLGVWLMLVLLARTSYIDEFRDLLQQDDTFTEENEEKPAEEEERGAMTFDEVSELLWSRNELETLQGIERLEALLGEDEAGDAIREEAGGTLPVEALEQLLQHRRADVRRRVIRLLRKHDVEGMAEAISGHLEDFDAGVRLEAARYLYHTLTGGPRRFFIAQGLEHDDRRIRAAAVGLVAKDGAAKERALLDGSLLEDLVTYEGEGADAVRREVARALAVVAWPGRKALLIDLMNDDTPHVAARAIKSAGRAGDRAFVPPLLDRLEGGGLVEEARQALAAFGARIPGTLYDYLTDERVSEEMRRRIPSVLAAERNQAAADVLLMSRRRTSVPVWHAVTRALSRLRRECNDEITFPEEMVRDAVRLEAACYTALGQVLHTSDLQPSAAQRLDADQLYDARRHSLERLCRLLGLRYRQDDLHNAYRGLVSEEEGLRSSAIEFLDNVLEWKLKRDLLPLLDDPQGKRAAGTGPGLFDLPPMKTWPAALAYLVDQSGDPELAAAALHSAAAFVTEGGDRQNGDAEARRATLRQRIEDATGHPHEDVRAAAREAASIVAQHRGADGPEGASEEEAGEQALAPSGPAGHAP